MRPQGKGSVNSDSSARPATGIDAALRCSRDPADLPERARRAPQGKPGRSRRPLPAPRRDATFAGKAQRMGEQLAPNRRVSSERSSDDGDQGLALSTRFTTRRAQHRRDLESGAGGLLLRCDQGGSEPRPPGLMAGSRCTANRTALARRATSTVCCWSSDGSRGPRGRGWQCRRATPREDQDQQRESVPTSPPEKGIPHDSGKRIRYRSFPSAAEESPVRTNTGPCTCEPGGGIWCTRQRTRGPGGHHPLRWRVMGCGDLHLGQQLPAGLRVHTQYKQTRGRLLLSPVGNDQ